MILISILDIWTWLKWRRWKPHHGDYCQHRYHDYQTRTDNLCFTLMLVTRKPRASHYRSSPRDQQSTGITAYDSKPRLSRPTTQHIENLPLSYRPSCCEHCISRDHFYNQNGPWCDLMDIEHEGHNRRTGQIAPNTGKVWEWSGPQEPRKTLGSRRIIFFATDRNGQIPARGRRAVLSNSQTTTTRRKHRDKCKRFS